MELGIIIPVVLIVVLAPIALVWAKRTFKDNAGVVDDAFVPPSDRLTSTALRDLESPPWRVVYEIAPDKLNGIGHVLIGPPGVYALQTTTDPLPHQPTNDHDARAVAEAAITRVGVDDALRHCAMSTDRLVMVHWGANDSAEIKVELMPGVTAVDGRAISTWAASVGEPALTASQVDLAWQTILTAIGRPDPLG